MLIYKKFFTAYFSETPKREYGIDKNIYRFFNFIYNFYSILLTYALANLNATQKKENEMSFKYFCSISH